MTARPRISQAYGANDLDGMREMMTHPCCLIGLADSGAHVGAQTDSCNATFLMSYWVRDREKLTGRAGIELERAVYLHTKEPARICGLEVRKTPSWPRSWANFSLLQLYSYRNAWANLHLLGQLNTVLAPGPRHARGRHEGRRQRDGHGEAAHRGVDEGIL